MMWYEHGGWGAGGWLAMSVMMILFGAGLVALVVWLVRTERPGHRADAAGSPLARADALLAERYARGEIDDEEYARRRRLLHEPAASR